MDGKPLHLSKTVVFNVLALLVLVANALGYADFIPDKSVADAALAIVLIVNLVLRFLTKEPVVPKL